MATWINFTRTNRGLALDAKLTGGESPLKITKAMSAAGKVSPLLLKEQTALTDPRQTLTILPKIETGDPTQFILPIKLTNEGITTRYNMYQLGIFAEDPDLGEILYMICQTSTESGEEIPTAADQPAFNIQWNHKISIADSSKVTIQVSEVGSITEEMADRKYSAKSKLANHTLIAAGWANGLYTYENPDITDNTVIELGTIENPTKEQLEALQQANIQMSAHAEGSITLKAYGTIPTIDIPVVFILRGDL